MVRTVCDMCCWSASSVHSGGRGCSIGVLVGGEWGRSFLSPFAERTRPNLNAKTLKSISTHDFSCLLFVAGLDWIRTGGRRDSK